MSELSSLSDFLNGAFEIANRFHIVTIIQAYVVIRLAAYAYRQLTSRWGD